MPAARLAAICTLLLLCCRGEARELLQDPHVVRGVAVVPVEQSWRGARERLCLPLRDCSLKPVWLLQQWGSRADIAAAVTEEPDPAAAWRSTHGWLLHDDSGRLLKRLQLAPADREQGDMVLAINGLAEFAAGNSDALPRYPTNLREPWPHWLMSQQLATGRLSQYRQLWLSGQWRLLQDDAQRQAGYDASLHAARLVLAMTVRNRLNGRHFWLNLALYDDRYTDTGFGCSLCIAGVCRVPQSLGEPGEWRCPTDHVAEPVQASDRRATGRMMFRMPSVAFLQGDARQGDWVQVQGDLLPYVRAGIAAARANEPAANSWQRFPDDLHFYEIGFFSMGWEITGFNQVAVQLRNWQLQGEEVDSR